MSREQFIKNKGKIDYDKPVTCSCCGRNGTLHRHGVYWRNTVEDDSEERIPIQRFFCIYCNHTISLLPSFCVPHFQYSAEFILKAIGMALASIIATLEVRLKSLFRFYKKRFIKNLPLSEVFLRSFNSDYDLPLNEKEKTTKIYQDLISRPGAETIFQQFLNHLNKHFMAR